MGRMRWVWQDKFGPPCEEMGVFSPYILVCHPRLTIQNKGVAQGSRGRDESSSKEVLEMRHSMTPLQCHMLREQHNPYTLICCLTQLCIAFAGLPLTTTTEAESNHETRLNVWLAFQQGH